MIRIYIFLKILQDLIIFLKDHCGCDSFQRVWGVGGKSQNKDQWSDYWNNQGTDHSIGTNKNQSDLIIFLKMNFREFLEGDVRDKGKSGWLKVFDPNNCKNEVTILKRESWGKIWFGQEVAVEKKVQSYMC